VVLLVVDLADFDGSFPAVAARLLSSLGDSTHVLLACTKADLLPRSASPARLEQWVRRRAKAGGLEHLHSVRFLGAPTRFGITALANALEELSSTRSGAEVWVVGAQNAGKSTLINALSAHYYGDGFQAGPVASHVPGTTLGLVRLESLLPGKRTVVDTPGLLHGHQLSGRLTPDEARIVLPRRPLRPRTYRVPHGSSVSVGGLFRVDVVDGPSSTLYLTVWASEDVPTHMGRSQGSEELFARHAGGALKPPLGAERVPELGRWAARSVGVSGTSWTASSRDVVVAGAGWAAVAVDGQAQLRVWTYEGVAVTERDALLPDLARELETPGFDFEKAGKSRGGREVRGRPRK
jgi:ribosome biogenesis GTPase A